VAKEVILYLGLHIYNGWTLAKYIFMDLSLVTGWLCIWGACAFHQISFDHNDICHNFYSLFVGLTSMCQIKNNCH
jgi:hypothetical protein